MSIRPLPLWMILLLGAGSSAAGPLDIRVSDDHGDAVADAVLTLTPTDASDPVRESMTQTRTIDQRDERFVPYVEVFHPGDRVVFHNSDSTRHHAYSFAPAASFEMVLKPGEESDPIPLQSTGTIAVGCNIHDQMITYLMVSDAPWLGRTGDEGRWQIEDLPPGNYQLTIWHPQIRPAGKPLVRELDVGIDSRSVELTLRLGPDPRGERDRERLDY